MKIKLVILTLMALLGTVYTASAANNEAMPDTITQKKTLTRYYIELQAKRSFVNNTTSVTIDYGRLLLQRFGVKEADVKKVTNSVTFTSVPDALNYMSARGWTLVDTYCYKSSAGECTNFVMMLETDDPSIVANAILKPTDR